MVLQDSIIRNCYCDLNGGGVHVFDKKNKIQRCIVYNCESGINPAGIQGGAGIAMRWEASANNCLVTRCTGNVAGIYVQSGVCEVAFCTAVENTLTPSFGFVGGITFLQTAAGTTCYNNISYFNEDPLSNSVNGITTVNLIGPVDIQGNDATNIVITGNTGADPEFVNIPYLNYRLEPTSPAIGLGIDTDHTRDLLQNEIINNDAGSYQFTPSFFDT